jgi:hypothetical protein
MFLNLFDMLISKIIFFKNKNIYVIFNIFLNKKHFETGPLLYSLCDEGSFVYVSIKRTLQLKIEVFKLIDLNSGFNLRSTHVISKLYCRVT